METEMAAKFTGEIMRWLSPKDKNPRYYKKRYNELIKRRCPGTCRWLLDEDHYLDWRQRDTSDSVLWLRGSPGTGKSMLTATVVEQLSKPETTLVLYYFIDSRSNDHALTTSVAVLRSLVYQISNSKGLSKTNLIKDAFEQRGGEDTADSFEELWGLFTALLCLRLKETTCIVLDGIDECPDINLLIPKLLEVVSSTECSVKLFFASRVTSERVLCKLLDFYTFINVSVSKTREDMDLYVSNRTKNVVGQIECLKNDLESISSSLRASANGMYSLPEDAI